MPAANGAHSGGRVGLVRDPLFLLHTNGPGHPESPERLKAIDAMLARFPRPDRLVEVPARDATREELSWVHGEAHIRAVESSRGRVRTEFDPDTSAGEHSAAAAVRAAGGLAALAEAVVHGRIAGGFALVRPPGHHAEAGRAMGFCLINNVAVAAEYARRRLGLDRVLVFDWDVHHGNGTMHSFYGTDRVLFCSVHQYPHYPGTGRIDEIGEGAGRGFTVNVPLPPGQGDGDYAAVVERILRPIAHEYRPQLVLVSAGFDIADGDPLADMRVTPRGFARMTGQLLALTGTCCPGRLAFSLEGGYDLGNLSRGVSAVLETLAGGAAAGVDEGAAAIEGPASGEEAAPEPRRETRAVIDEVLRTLRPYWKNLT